MAQNVSQNYANTTAMFPLHKCKYSLSGKFYPNIFLTPK